MASYSSASRSLPDMELVVNPAPSTAYESVLETPPVKQAYLPAKGYNIIDAPTIVNGGDPVRIVFEFPEPMTVRDDIYKIIASFILPAAGAPSQLVLFPTKLVFYNQGLDLPPQLAGYTGTLNFKPRARIKYIYEISGPDADHVVVNVWDESGGNPLATASVTVTGILTPPAGEPAKVILGWPSQTQVALLEEQFAEELKGSLGYPVRPYNVIVHSMSVGNLGPTGATFVQQTALSQAADLPAGTYVGYFEPVHALGIKSHVVMVDLASEYEVKNNKLYTKVKSSLLTVNPGQPDITVTDIFNLAATAVSMTPPLIVTA